MTWSLENHPLLCYLPCWPLLGLYCSWLQLLFVCGSLCFIMIDWYCCMLWIMRCSFPSPYFPQSQYLDICLLWSFLPLAVNELPSAWLFRNIPSFAVLSDRFFRVMMAFFSWISICLDLILKAPTKGYKSLVFGITTWFKCLLKLKLKVCTLITSWLSVFLNRLLWYTEPIMGCIVRILMNLVVCIFF